jgi:rod shape-determining protein MreD
VKWTRAAALALVCALVPLLAPAAWLQHGAFPDVAAIAVVYCAIAVGSDQAALLGVAIGLAGAPFTPEPFGQQAFLLGALGWVAGRTRGAFHRDRVLVQVAFVAAGVIALRLGAAAATELTLGSATAPGAGAWPVGALPEGTDDPAGTLAAPRGLVLRTTLSAAVLAAIGSALAAPPLFAALRGSRLLVAFERRSARRV